MVAACFVFQLVCCFGFYCVGRPDFKRPDMRARVCHGHWKNIIHFHLDELQLLPYQYTYRILTSMATEQKIQ